MAVPLPRVPPVIGERIEVDRRPHGHAPVRRSGGTRRILGTQHRARLLAGVVLALLMVAYASSAGTLALRRHWNLQSQALDMGYADQVMWNTLHGRPFRFTLFRGLVGTEFGRSLEFGPGADRDSLLAYHVELLFLPLSLLYLLYPGPELLIVTLTLTLALGAVPVYLIARHRMGTAAGALAFAGAYLLTPSVQAANLADFHIVSMAPTFLLFALWFLLRRRTVAFAITAVLCAAIKEEVGLIVAMIGLYAWVARGERRLGLTTAAAALAWVALCFLVIIPHFNGGAPSLFGARYADTLADLRRWPGELAAGRVDWPVPEYTLTYARELLAGTGFLAVLAPLPLAIAAPVLAINGLSASTWQHGGGAHYSAEAVPALLFAAICAAGRLSALAWRRFTLAPAKGALLLSLVALGGALVQAREHGILPPARRFALPERSGRWEVLQSLAARIPLDAPLSAQSNVFPHLSRRERIYVFPAIDDARYVLIDVAGASDPLTQDDLVAEVNTLLAGSRFTLLEAVDGFLLFERSEHRLRSVGRVADLPPAFLDFTRPPPGTDRSPASSAPLAVFDGVFEVVDYGIMPLAEVHFTTRRVAPTVLVRARRPVDRAYRFVTYVVGRDGLAHLQDDGNATQLWRPTYRWAAGETLRLTYPPLSYLPGARLGLGVQIGTDPPVQRLRADAPAAQIVDNGYVVVLGPLP